MLLGMLLSLLDSRWQILARPTRDALSFLADIGVIALLFQVGLQSHPRALLNKLPQALKIWLGDVLGSAALGFAAAYFLLELSLIPSLIAAAALTATSVGVSVQVWRDHHALESDQGRLLVDLAELDDISAVALMALLFALVTTLHQGDGRILTTLTLTGLGFAGKLALFILVCYLFARYLEPPITRLSSRLEPAPQRMLTVAGMGFIIAAFANWLGFSLAIGALFAGLAFSGDPRAIKTENSFKDIYAFATPFFFLYIGLGIDFSHVAAGAALGSVMLIAAIAGKFIGAGLPTVFANGLTGGVLIGVSMIPRAEIAMIVAHQARQMGSWAMPEELYAAIVFVSMITCIGTPLLLYRLLHYWPPKPEQSP